MNIISVKENLGVPKYKQIVTSIEEAIKNKELKKGDKLPSINSIRQRFNLSRDTVLMAFKELKVRGIVLSIAGKGYYVKSDTIHTAKRIFLLFDELNAFKEDLYNSFLASLGENIEVDIYFHHFNMEIFTKLIYDSIGNYNAYVIIPANLKQAHEVLERLPQDKTYILDQTYKELSKYPAIYQNFKKDSYNALSTAYTHIKKYHHITLVLSTEKQPIGILQGFETFCKSHRVSNTVVTSASDVEIQRGEIYFIPDDRDLITIIKKIKLLQYTLGKDVGIISYNDTPLKEIVANGITTISTDFVEMGKRLAAMILDKEKKQIENTNNLILRSSL